MQAPHILLIEDDPAIATPLRYACEREGWQVTWLAVAAIAVQTLAKSDIQAVILDIGLPDIDGLTLCQHIRHSSQLNQSQQMVPVLFLTARSDEVDRIIGLELGADDYCAKPFSPREIIARIKAIWRRDNSLQQPEQKQATVTNTPQFEIKNQGVEAVLATSFQCLPWQYNAKQYQLSLHNQALHLSKTELQLMLMLIHHPKQIFSREQLLANISDHPEHRLARTVDSHIKSIRQKISRVDPEQTYIITHRGLGYSLQCEPVAK